MILHNATRLGAIVLTVFVASAAPVSSMAAGHGVAQNQAAQIAPSKPSAAVPASLPVNQPTGNSDLSAPLAAEAAAQSLDVDFAKGKITVDATNVSLNKVLHEVAAKAGIKLTGSVSDERVFGRYGPSSPSMVLATLLDGTGTNMLLVDDSKGASELILTQRVGGPTPPSAPSAAQAFIEDQDGRQGNRYVPPTRPFQPPLPGRGPLSQPPNFGPPSQNGSQTGSNPTDSPQPSSDTRTPQQIYDQLQNQQKPPDQPPQ